MNPVQNLVLVLPLVASLSWAEPPQRESAKIIASLAEYLPDEPGLSLSYRRSSKWSTEPAEVVMKYTQVEKISGGKAIVFLSWQGSNAVERVVLVARGAQMAFLHVDSPGSTNPAPLAVTDIKRVVNESVKDLQTLAEISEKDDWRGLQPRENQVVGLVMGGVRSSWFSMPLQPASLFPEFVSVTAYGFSSSLYGTTNRIVTAPFRPGLLRFGAAILQRNVGILRLWTGDATRGGNQVQYELVNGTLPAQQGATRQAPALLKTGRYRQDNWQYEVHLHLGDGGEQTPYAFLSKDGAPLVIGNRWRAISCPCLLTPWGFMSQRKDGCWLPVEAPPMLMQASAAPSGECLTPPIALNEPLPEVVPRSVGSSHTDPKTGKRRASPLVYDAFVAEARTEPHISFGKASEGSLSGPKAGGPYLVTQSFRLMVRLKGTGTLHYKIDETIELSYWLQPWERAIGKGEQVLWGLDWNDGKPWGNLVLKDTEENRAILSK